MAAPPLAIEPDQHADTSMPAASSPWLTIKEEAAWARCGRRQLYEAVHRGDLRAVRVGGRGELRFKRAWIDQWLEGAPASPRQRPVASLRPRR